MADTDLHVVLVNPEIHWNTGNAGRTCLATGARLHLVEPLGFSLDAARLRRAGLDYWARVPLSVWPDWATFEAALPTLGEPWMFSAEAGRSFWETSFATPTVLIFGRESDGLPATLRQRHPDRLVRVPMADPALRSLNLSTAVAVAAYEVRRQQRRGAICVEPREAAGAACDRASPNVTVLSARPAAALGSATLPRDNGAIDLRTDRFE